MLCPLTGQHCRTTGSVLPVFQSSSSSPRLRVSSFLFSSASALPPFWWFSIFLPLSILSTLPYSNLVVVFGALEQRVPTSLRALIRCTRIFTYHLLYLRPTGRLIPILIFSPSFSGLTWFFVSTISHFLVGYCGWCDRFVRVYLVTYWATRIALTTRLSSHIPLQAYVDSSKRAECLLDANLVHYVVCVFVAAELREFFST